jgi:AraC-like DNA-binding protein
MFKRHVGVTLHRYLRDLRLHRATQALLESGDSLAALADSHGFADQSHLTRALQHGTGWTPHRLRCACERLS